MNHARNPALLLCQLFPLVVIGSSPGILTAQLRGMYGSSSSVWLVTNENVA